MFNIMFPRVQVDDSDAPSWIKGELESTSGITGTVGRYNTSALPELIGKYGIVCSIDSQDKFGVVT